MSRFEKLSQENNKPKAEASEEIFMTKSEIEALREEAEQIERELEEDPFIDSMDPPKELYNRIVQELKDKGIYHEDEEDFNEEKEEVVEEKKKVVFYSRWKRAGKCAAIVCLTMSGVFGVAMTSEANRVYLLEQVNSLLGKNVDIKINNDANRKTESGTEIEVMETIENELNVKMPMFGEIPKGMRYKTFKLDKDLGVAIMEYTYNDNSIYIYVSNNQEDAAELSSYDGKLIKSVAVYNSIDEINIWEIQADNDESPTYLAQWNYKNSYYEISGKMDQENFISLIEKISI